MKSLFTCLFVFISFLSFSQRTIDVDKQDSRAVNSSNFYIVNGEPFLNVKFTKLVEGSPYFKDEWLKGVASADSFNTYSGMLKLDLLDNQIHFLDKNGVEMVSSIKLKKLVLIDTNTQTSYLFTHSSAINSDKLKTGWYLVLSETSAATLYKQELKIMQELRPFNSATFEQYIRTYNNYFLQVDGKLQEVRKLKELPELLADKKNELAKYISENKLNGKSDSDFINVMTYYKSLRQ